jgi:acetyl-CoA C-acetyltransferase
MQISMEMGVFGLDSTKVSSDGIQGVYHGVLDIMSGHHDVVMVVAHRKESETVASVVESASFDPIYMRPLGLDFLGAAALQAQRYMSVYKVTPEQCAKVVVKNKANAQNNPYAQEPMTLTISDVLNSEWLCEPIRALEVKPVSDGAAALILACEEKAYKITERPVWIKGIGNAYDTHYLGDRDLSKCDALVAAAKRAYAMAGITDPVKNIDVAEISEKYAYQELLWYEGLGFCEPGMGGHLIDSGVTSIRGSLPVNPSGGVLGGNPSGVSGLTRVVECFLQLRGEAGSRQIDNVHTSLSHGWEGPCGQSQCVIILGI